MPIDFACECGKWLQVEDQYAGKQAKCPSCGRVVTVPPPTPAAATAPPGPPPAQHFYPGARQPAYADAARFRKVSVTALWMGILGCVAPILGILVSLLAAAGASRYRGPSPELGIFVLLLYIFGAGASITGIVTGAIGLKPANTRYKGHAITGLVTGIVGVCLVGCILACAVIFVSQAARWR